jgi:4-diphosphocytidyl-2-C-methyl-D-erythritol kinase
MTGERSTWSHALAPAKVNPYLAVLARRADGYHELDTLMLALDWCDRVSARVVERPGIELAISGPHASPDVPSDERNLAFRAAGSALELARERGVHAPGLELRLEKHVPSQAGLGGGSSDAAAAWLAVASLLGVADDGARAERELAALGSDCVFFWTARATGFARCRGRGERVESLANPARAWTLVVITPACGSPTAAVYREFASSLSPSGSDPIVPLDLLAFDEPAARSACSNRLEPAALCAVPELARWRRVLDECELGHFRLCGSGSSFFGLFARRADADAAVARIAARCAALSFALREARVVRLAGHGARLVP